VYKLIAEYVDAGSVTHTLEKTSITFVVSCAALTLNSLNPAYTYQKPAIDSGSYVTLANILSTDSSLISNQAGCPITMTLLDSGGNAVTQGFVSIDNTYPYKI
jgi:hypothetical protein